MMFPQQPSSVGAPDVANRDRIVGAQSGLDQLMPLLELLAQLLPGASSGSKQPAYKSSQLEGRDGASRPLRDRMMPPSSQY